MSPVLRVAVVGLCAFIVSVQPAAAQDPPDSVRVAPDTAVADSMALDSLGLLADSLLADSLLADSLRLDSLSVDTLPLLDLGAPALVEAGVWEWDQEALLWASGFTLADLLRDVPGIWITRTGDYGSPVTTTGFGTGRLRVRIDGVEWSPLEAGVVDLAQVALAGMRTVRVHRRVGGVVVDLYSIRPEDRRAYSVIEAGTGDLETNLFRGTFMLPGALGGTVTGVIERIDTQGEGREEPGALTGVWLRYTFNFGRRGGLEVDYRSRKATQELFVPNQFARSDLTLRGRFRLAEDIVLSGHYTTTGFNDGDGGLLSDSVTGEPVPISGESLSQVGAEVSVRRDIAWGRAAYKYLSGAGLPSSIIEVEAGADDARWGGVLAELRREGWESQSAQRTGLRAWTTDRYGAYGFVEIDRGSSGIPFVPLLNGGLQRIDSTGALTPEPGVLRIQERNASRFGVGARWRGLEAEVARLSVEGDAVHPLGFPTDRGPFAVAGGERSGLEVRAQIPLLVIDGLEFRGSAVRWDALEATGPVDSLSPPATVIDPWPYLPELSYDARLHYRNTFLPTGNFEMLAAVGVRERDAMTVFTAIDTVGAVNADPEPTEPRATASVPFSQTWYARLELRIVSLRVFVEWENLTLRAANQDFPERILPRTRAMYGVRWTLRN